MALAAAAFAAAGLVAGAAQQHAQAATITCGVWRWPVKTGSDPTVPGINHCPLHHD